MNGRSSGGAPTPDLGVRVKELENALSRHNQSLVLTGLVSAVVGSGGGLACVKYAYDAPFDQAVKAETVTHLAAQVEDLRSQLHARDHLQTNEDFERLFWIAEQTDNDAMRKAVLRRWADYLGQPIWETAEALPRTAPSPDPLRQPPWLPEYRSISNRLRGGPVSTRELVDLCHAVVDDIAERSPGTGGDDVVYEVRSGDSIRAKLRVVPRLGERESFVFRFEETPDDPAVLVSMLAVRFGFAGDGRPELVNGVAQSRPTDARIAELAGAAPMVFGGDYRSTPESAAWQPIELTVDGNGGLVWRDGGYRTRASDLDVSGARALGARLAELRTD